MVGEPEPAEGKYTQLAEVARALGLAYRGALALDFTVDGAPVTMSLEVDSGTVVGLSLKLALEVPHHVPAGPTLELRKEDDADRTGKRRGINRELQTGDAPFDEAVYVDSDASDDDVLRVLASARVRGAALALLEGGASAVQLTTHHVTVRWKERKTPGVYEPAHLLPALRDVLAVASAGGPHTRGPSQRGRWLPWAALLGLFFGLPYTAVVLGVYAPEDRSLPLLGLLVGPALSIAARPLLARYLAGYSASWARYRISVTGLFLAFALLGAGVPAHLNAALDRSRPVDEPGTVVSVGRRDEENGTTEVEVEWIDGRRTTASVRPPVAAGDTVVQRRHAGALGQSWTEAPLVVRGPAR